jgi:hypothetical protein
MGGKAGETLSKPSNGDMWTVTASGGWNREFFKIIIATVAQLVERQFCKLRVAGSNPVRGSILFPFRPARTLY